MDALTNDGFGSGDGSLAHPALLASRSPATPALVGIDRPWSIRRRPTRRRDGRAAGRPHVAMLATDPQIPARLGNP